MADEALDPKRTALVYFDTLKTYAYDRELKGVVPEARHQVDAMVRLRKLAKSAGIPVFYARADHRPDGKDGATAITDLELARPAGGGGGGEGFGGVWGSERANIIDEIAPDPEDYQIPKHRWNMFFQTELEQALRTRDIDTILLAGGSTEVGVASSAYYARDADFNTVIVREAQRSGRGRWITDFYVNEVAPGHTRVRSLAQVVQMLKAGGAAVEEDTSPLAEQVGSTDQPAFGTLARDPSMNPAESAVLLFDFLKGGNYDRESKKLSEASRSMVEAAQKMIAAASSMGMPIFYTQAIHRPDGADWASAINDRDAGRRRVDRFGRERTQPGSTAGSWNAEIIDEQAPQPGDYIIRKHRWSAFHGTHLELSLRRAGIQNILLAGSTMDVGIASTAYASRDRDYNTVLLRDAQRARTPEVESYFMDHVFPRLGRVRTVDRAIELLQGKGTE